MAVMQKTEQQYKVGDIVEFIGYDGDDTQGELTAGDQLKITGYDDDQELYNVMRVSDSHEDSLFDVEFQAITSKKATKAKAAKAAPVEIEEDEEEASAPVAKKSSKAKASKPVEIEEDEEDVEETPVVRKAGRPKAVKSVEVDEEEEEAPAPVAKKSAGRPKATKQVEDDEEVQAPVAKKATKQKASKPAPIEDEEEQDEAPVAKKVAKAKAAKQVEDSDDDELPEFVETASVADVLEQHEGDALAAAGALAEAKERTIFTLGGVLAFIKRNNSFTDIEVNGDLVYEKGLKGFNAYVKDELGVEARSAAYYVDLYEMFSQVTSEEKIAKIGWTKLRELLPLKTVIDEKNVDKWLKKAKEMPTKELHDLVTKELVNAGEKTHGNRQTAEQTTFKFVVHNDQANTLEEAIAKAKDIIGDDCSDGAALVHIVSEWLEHSDSE